MDLGPGDLAMNSGDLPLCCSVLILFSGVWGRLAVAAESCMGVIGLVSEVLDTRSGVLGLVSSEIGSSW